MTATNPEEAASPLAVGNIQSAAERPVDVAGAHTPASTLGQEIQDLEQTHSDQMVDVEEG